MVSRFAAARGRAGSQVGFALIPVMLTGGLVALATLVVQLTLTV